MAKVTVLLCFCILAVFGSVNAHTEKEKVGIYELKRGDMSLKFTNWGATLVSFVLPDKNGGHCYSSVHLNHVLDLWPLGRIRGSIFSLLSVCPLFHSFLWCVTGKLIDIVLGYDTIKQYKVGFHIFINL
jgi:hypothetical protein